VWEAHRDHYYQRLVQMGWGHRKTALAESAVMAAGGLAALGALALSPALQAAALAGATAIYGVFIALIEVKWRRTAGHGE